MKKRRTLLLTLLAVLLVVGMPTGLLVRQHRREQASRDLIDAIAARDTSAALAALNAGADPNARVHSDKELAANEAPLSFTERMKQLLDRVLHPNAKTEFDDDLTAFLLCIYNPADDNLSSFTENNPTLVKALLDAGANPNATYLFGHTPLMFASDGRHPQLLRLLLKYGGNPHLKNQRSWTALHFMARSGNMEDLPLLLNAGADINAKALDGETPLVMACQHDHVKAVQMLLKHHADPNIRDHDGSTPLDWALINKETKSIHLLKQAGAKTGEELDAEIKKGGKP